MIAALPLMNAVTVPAHAQPNYEVFLEAIHGDGVVMDDQQAIAEGYAVCKLMRPPNGGSLWDAAQKVKSMHADWPIGRALSFADRSVQDICPERGESM